jgi:ATP-dependent DNA helicase RecG
MDISDSILCIKGIGEKTAAMYKKLGIITAGDLLRHYPKEYDEFRLPLTVEKLNDGEISTIEVTLSRAPALRMYNNMKIVICRMSDAKAAINVIWYNMPFLAKTLRFATHYCLRGMVVRKGSELVMQQPKIYTEEEYRGLVNRLMPVYSLTKGLTNNALRKAEQQCLNLVEIQKDYLSRKQREALGIEDLKSAMDNIHFPKNREDVIEARKRLVFDEAFAFSCAMRCLKKETKKIPNQYRIEIKDIEKFTSQLPYSMTAAQIRAISEITADMSSEYAMNRLLQGDVGSGKTAVSAAALYLALVNGYQGALMAPTEVLAEQHFGKLAPLFKKFGFITELLTGSTSKAERKRIYEALANHECDLIIGTNALLQDKLVYANLGLVVTDEQHRFGVRQRKMFANKGKITDESSNVMLPHVLSMSATPIPRTLAIIIYADMDISVLDEMPKGRLQIKNCVVGTQYREKAWNFIGSQVMDGRQAYIICPMIDGVDGLELESVNEYTGELRKAMKGDISVASLTGRMSGKEKEKVLKDFYNKKIDILVSTTVIEVGIDVPNSTVMLIENAERFGLASLHQLRGRVGRGSEQSYCIFMCGRQDENIIKRLDIMGKSNDGFLVAQKDLELRGPGDFFGIRQSGDMQFTLADIFQDAKIFEKANSFAENMDEQSFSEISGKNMQIKQMVEGISIGSI